MKLKTTTRRKVDYGAKRFFLSTNEFEVFKKNKRQFKLYRVYDIENAPSFEKLDLETIEKKSDGYICTY